MNTAILILTNTMFMPMLTVPFSLASIHINMYTKGSTTAMLMLLTCTTATNTNSSKENLVFEFQSQVWCLMQHFFSRFVLILVRLDEYDFYQELPWA